MSDGRITFLVSSNRRHHLCSHAPADPGLTDPIVRSTLNHLTPTSGPLHRHGALQICSLARPRPLHFRLSTSSVRDRNLTSIDLDPSNRQILIGHRHPTRLTKQPRPDRLFPRSTCCRVCSLAKRQLSQLSFPTLRNPARSTKRFLSGSHLLF